MHALQTDVLFNTNNRTNNGRRSQKSTAATRLPSQCSPTPRTPPAVIASATRCHVWHPCPVPHCQLFDVERAVSTTPSGTWGVGSLREPSLSAPPRRRRRRHHPSPLPTTYDVGFSWFSPKQVPFEDTTEAVKSRMRNRKWLWRGHP
jgi:hypothetical protein